MIITARFFSSDDAEFAAATIRKNTDGIASVRICENPTGAHRDRDFAPIGFFSNMTSGNAPGIPVPLFEFYSDEVEYDPPEPKAATLEIVCRPSEARRVSSVLINKGGHDLRGDSH